MLVRLLHYAGAVCGRWPGGSVGKSIGYVLACSVHYSRCSDLLRNKLPIEGKNMKPAKIEEILTLANVARLSGNHDGKTYVIDATGLLAIYVSGHYEINELMEAVNLLREANVLWEAQGRKVAPKGSEMIKYEKVKRQGGACYTVACFCYSETGEVARGSLFGITLSSAKRLAAMLPKLAAGEFERVINSDSSIRRLPIGYR